MNTPLTIHLMTAGLTPGDAISNNVLSVSRMLRKWGAAVRIYADHIAPEYAAMAEPSRFYQPTGQALLWFHFSLYSENVEIALASNDYKIMDYHGICPPRLFKGQNAHLEYLCQKGIELRPSLHDKFDAYVVHTEYTRNELQSLGFPPERIFKLFYCVDRTHFEETADPELSSQLSQLTYFLLVGRIVPQKDVGALIEIFSYISQHKPDTVLMLVGSRQQTPKYQRQLDDQIAHKGLKHRVMFTGQVNNPTVLAALFKNARLLFVTSEWESFCVPIAESLYFNVPAAVHNGPPLPEVAGPAGIVFDKNDPKQAADKVMAVLADESGYQRLRVTAGAWADQYSDASLERNIMTLFSKLFDLQGLLATADPGSS